MISSKKELKFYLTADRYMNKGRFKLSAKDYLLALVCPDNIDKFLVLLRKVEYFSSRRDLLGKIRLTFVKIRFKKISVKLGFSIAPGVFGYGLCIPHYGTIVVGPGNKIGNYAVLHTSTCITEGRKIIGGGLYLSTGGKILNDIELRSGVSIAANAVVNCSFSEENIMLAGVPAKKIKDSKIWYERDGEKYLSRVNQIEKIKFEWGIYVESEL